MSQKVVKPYHMQSLSTIVFNPELTVQIKAPDKCDARQGVMYAGDTHGEQFEEGILKDCPLLVLVGNHGNVDLAQILREQKNQTHRSV